MILKYIISSKIKIVCYTYALKGYYTAPLALIFEDCAFSQEIK